MLAADEMGQDDIVGAGIIKLQGLLDMAGNHKNGYILILPFGRCHKQYVVAFSRDCGNQYTCFPEVQPSNNFLIAHIAVKRRSLFIDERFYRFRIVVDNQHALSHAAQGPHYAVPYPVVAADNYLRPFFARCIFKALPVFGEPVKKAQQPGALSINPLFKADKIRSQGYCDYCNQDRGREHLLAYMPEQKPLGDYYERELGYLRKRNCREE